MEKTSFLITDAAKQVQVENHVLRYWEEELGLTIKRNEMGHRYYTKDDIQSLIKVKQLKDQGIQLKAIRTMLHGEKKEFGMVQFKANQGALKENPPMMAEVENRQLQEEHSVVTGGDAQTDKIIRLQELLKQLIGETVKENTRGVYEEMRDSILKEIDYQFRTQEEHEDKREEERRKREEEHFKNIDELLRNKSKRKKHSIF